MSRQSRWTAAVLIVSLTGVMFGGWVLLQRLVANPAYGGNELHQDLWRAGHAHAGVLLIVTLVLLPWIDAARFHEATRWWLRVAISQASITFPLAFFLAVPDASVTEAGPMLGLLWPGAGVLAVGLAVLAWGLIRSPRA